LNTTNDYLKIYTNKLIIDFQSYRLYINYKKNNININNTIV